MMLYIHGASKLNHGLVAFFKGYYKPNADLDHINTLRLGQSDYHSADDISKYFSQQSVVFWCKFHWSLFQTVKSIIRLSIFNNTLDVKTYQNPREVFCLKRCLWIFMTLWFHRNLLYHNSGPVKTLGREMVASTTLDSLGSLKLVLLKKRDDYYSSSLKCLHID